MNSQLLKMYTSFLDGGVLDYTFLEEVANTSLDRRETSLALDLLQVKGPIPEFGNVRWMLERRNRNLFKQKLKALC